MQIITYLIVIQLPFAYAVKTVKTEKIVQPPPPERKLVADDPECLQPKVYCIDGDTGGVIDEYEQKAHELKESGARVKILGKCNSACTLFAAILPRERVCVGERAVLGFHEAYQEYSKTNIVIRRDETDRMLAQFPEEIQEWFARVRYSRPPRALKYLAGDDLRRTYNMCNADVATTPRDQTLANRTPATTSQ
jgi:hypothetical protein